MRKRLIVVILCAILVSALSVTSVVSAHQVDARQSDIYFILASLYKFWQSKMNPTQIPIGTPIALLVIGIVTLITPLGSTGANVAKMIYCQAISDTPCQSQ
jgi:hypothetical protein